jgi:hypothetical protein
MGSLALTVGLLTVPNEAQATSLKKMTTVDMVDTADLVVRGTVAETWTEVGEHGRIWTRAQIDIQQTYKGETGLETIVVDQLGGHYAGVTMHIEGASRFSQDEEVVIFLDELESGRISPLGMFTGKWTVRLDPYTQTKIVQRFTVAASQDYDHRFIPLPQAEDRIYLSDFETTVLDRVRLIDSSIVTPITEVK